MTEDKLITCEGCGWQWKLSEGGNDPYVCHKCGHDNTPQMKDANELKKMLREELETIVKSGIIDDVLYHLGGARVMRSMTMKNFQSFGNHTMTFDLTKPSKDGVNHVRVTRRSAPPSATEQVPDKFNVEFGIIRGLDYEPVEYIPNLLGYQLKDAMLRIGGFRAQVF